MDFRRRRAATGLPILLIGLPLGVMITSVFLQGSNIAGQGNGNFTVCNPNNTDVNGKCNLNPPSTPGGSTSTTTFTCAQSGFGGGLLSFIKTPCSLPGPCPATPPAQTYCSLNGTWLLNNGQSIAIQNALLFNGTVISSASGTTQVVGGQSNSKGVLFGLGNITPAGFINLILVVVGLLALAGITILGTGASFTSLQILFVGGIMFGLWTILSIVDGFFSNPTNPNSMFNQLNFWTIDGLGLGSTVYIFLTFMYFGGFLALGRTGT